MGYAIQAVQDAINDLPDGSDCAKSIKDYVAELEAEKAHLESARDTARTELEDAYDEHMQWDYTLRELSEDKEKTGGIISNAYGDESLKVKFILLRRINRTLTAAETKLGEHNKVYEETKKQRDEEEKSCYCDLQKQYQEEETEATAIFKKELKEWTNARYRQCQKLEGIEYAKLEDECDITTNAPTFEM